MQKVFVQLDKCLEQFLKGEDGENDYQRQIFLSLMADSNNTKVLEAAQKYPMLKDMIDEAKMFVHDKEVQAMLLMEKYNEADLNAVRSYERNEGRAEERAEKLQTAIERIMEKNHVSREEAEAQARYILGLD